MPNPLSDPTFPQNLEAERAILGSILLDNGALNGVVEGLGSDVFFSESNRFLFNISTTARRLPSPSRRSRTCLRPNPSRWYCHQNCHHRMVVFGFFCPPETCTRTNRWPSNAVLSERADS